MSSDVLDVDNAFGKDELCGCIRKPFKGGELLSLVTRCLNPDYFFRICVSNKFFAIN